MVEWLKSSMEFCKQAFSKLERCGQKKKYMPDTDVVAVIKSLQENILHFESRSLHATEEPIEPSGIRRCTGNPR